MASWYELLKEAMNKDGEDFDRRFCTLTEKELLVEFNDTYGGAEGAPFTAWGENWVYFPVCYDGLETVGHVPRHPCNISSRHVGSE